MYEYSYKYRKCDCHTSTAIIFPDGWENKRKCFVTIYKTELDKYIGEKEWYKLKVKYHKTFFLDIAFK